jgi:tRNA (cytidine32/uridine32-2'-O)-methyltransferase
MSAEIRIVLIETSHPGNIGAAARAMKVMGLRRLVLVNPQCEVGSEARARASGAADVINAVVTVPALDVALEGTRFVVGTSARARRLGPGLVDLHAGAVQLMRLAGTDEVAILFGPERTGLDNAALDCCNQLWRIPTAADYGSLNLAAAVQVVTYELRVARDGDITVEAKPFAAAPAEEVAALCGHFDRVARRIESINPNAPRLALRRVQRLVRRARPESSEVKLLRGFLSAVERATGRTSNTDEGEK